MVIVKSGENSTAKKSQRIGLFGPILSLKAGAKELQEIYSMANISFYGSHNSAVVVEDKGQIICVVEIERFLNKKNAGYSQYLVSYTRPYLLKEIVKWIEEKYGISHYDTCYFLNSDTIEGDKLVFYHQLIPANNYVNCLHHLSHACCGFYQSSFERALIFSFDGGGNDGFFNVYLAENRETIKEIDRLNLDLGFPYMSFGQYFNDIKMEPDLSLGNLVYSGKIMGLCSYGNLREQWLEPFKAYYRSNPNGTNYLELLKKLTEQTGIEFDISKRLEGQFSWDVAKTSQIAFEEVFLEKAKPYLEKFNNIPVILVGGCALNILLNTRLKEQLRREVFVPPNPNDCGIACGMLLNHMKPKQAVDLTYSGLPLLDKDLIVSYCEENWSAVPLDIDLLVNDLIEQKIIGIARGRSEHGPRALGNRSIICDPTSPDMKDILNSKVKNREWYRPFAPVVRLEDVSTYFEFEGESRWMSFCPKVKPQWREKLASITHVDGTARVQTVTEQQNPFLYKLLTEFKKKSGVGVLLNTSFNVNGKPILTTVRDALEVYNETKMDCLVLENYYFRK
jgi:carbamoyltransferase